MTFKDILKDLRQEYALSQKEVAAECDLSPQCISQLEMGTRNPTGSTLVALANFFDCTIDYLMGRDDNFGKSTAYRTTDSIHSLSPKEQHLINALRATTPHNLADLISLYIDLPVFLQESIYSELKGAHLAYKISKNKKEL